MKCEWIDNEWIENLLGAPSQCYRRVKCDGKVYTLYLRWRWEDPWEFYIAEGDMVKQRGLYIIDLRRGVAKRFIGVNEKGEFILEEVKWKFVSDDLFFENNIFFRESEHKEAERKAEELFLK